MASTSLLEQVSSARHFGGFNRRYKHKSSMLGNTDAVFTVYFPPQAEQGPVPVIYYLSGLTCTDENFIQKAGAQRAAAAFGVALVAPDTSPRGLAVPGEADSWDFGVGAGFYLNATQEKWKAWQMYSYVTEELPAVLSKELISKLDVSRASIFGHSMGGHGALTIALKNPQNYKSVSAFSPICNPTAVPWGVKAFSGYLGEDRAAWAQYDATELLKTYAGPQLPMLIDQGTADSFLATQLMPQALEAVAKERGHPLTLRMQQDYDHSYYFISSFIEDHIAFHAEALGLSAK